MTTQFVGDLSLGVAMPLALEAQASLDASVAVGLPELQARIAAIGQLLVRLASSPTNITDLLSIAGKLQGALSVTFTPPIPQIDAVAAVLGELEAALGSLQASATFSASFGALLGTPGFYLYRYAGPVNALGSEMTGQLSGGLPPGGAPTLPVNSVILICNDGGAIAALEAMFAT